MTSNSNKHIQVCCRIRCASIHAGGMYTNNDLHTQASNINNSEVLKYDYDNINISSSNSSSNYDDSINCVHKRIQSSSDLDYIDAEDEDASNDQSGSSKRASTATVVHEVATTNGIYQMDYVFDRDDSQVLCLHRHHHHHYHQSTRYHHHHHYSSSLSSSSRSSSLSSVPSYSSSSSVPSYSSSSFSSSSFSSSSSSQL